MTDETRPRLALDGCLGDPVEINTSVGAGMKIMTVDEWISRWKQNERFHD